MTSPWIAVYKFTFQGIEGDIQVNGKVVFVRYGNMGAHLDCVVGELRDFVIEVLKQHPDQTYWK